MRGDSVRSTWIPGGINMVADMVLPPMGSGAWLVLFLDRASSGVTEITVAVTLPILI